MRRSEILIVFGLIVFGLLYQMLDSGKEPAGNTATKQLRALLDGPMQRIEKPLLAANQFKRVLIVNPAGDMTFRNNETGAIEVLPTVECYKISAREAKKMAQRVEIVKSLDEDGTLTIKARIPRSFDFKHLRVRLDIRIPRSFPLQVFSRYGLLQMDHLGNPTQLDISRGDLEANGHDASLRIQHSHGRIKVSGISDVLEIKTAFSQLEIRQCREVAVTGHHSRMQMEHIRGNVYISNRHERIRLQDVKGGVNIQVSDCPVQLDDIDAFAMAIRNNYKSVKGRQLAVATLDAMVSHGNLDLRFKRLSDTLSIKARQSKLRLHLPEGIAPMIQVQLKYGRFINQSSMKLEIEKTRTLERVSSLGDMPIIVVEGHYSDMVLYKSAASATSADN